jgi:hypothetical protein
VRAEPNASKVDLALKRKPLKEVLENHKVFLSAYISVASAPPGTEVTSAFTVTHGGKTVFERSTSRTPASEPAGTLREHATFNPAASGKDTVTVRVTVGDHTLTKSISIKVLRA